MGTEPSMSAVMLQANSAWCPWAMEYWLLVLVLPQNFFRTGQHKLPDWLCGTRGKQDATLRSTRHAVSILVRMLLARLALSSTAWLCTKPTALKTKTMGTS